MIKQIRLDYVLKLIYFYMASFTSTFNLLSKIISLRTATYLNYLNHFNRVTYDRIKNGVYLHNYSNRE